LRWRYWDLINSFDLSCADDLLEKKEDVDANDAEDTEVEPLVPMFGAEFAVQPQLVGSNPVVPVDGAGALVLFCDRHGLGNLDDHLVWRRPAGLVQLTKVLTLNHLPLAQSTRCCDEEVTVPINPGDCHEYRLVGVVVD
jgi:hypothetical protein